MNWLMAYKVFWPAWIAVALIVEAMALFNKRTGDTLSEQVWGWMNVKFVYWFVLFFLAWLIAHFASRGRWA